MSYKKYWRIGLLVLLVGLLAFGGSADVFGDNSSNPCPDGYWVDGPGITPGYCLPCADGDVVKADVDDLDNDTITVNAGDDGTITATFYGPDDDPTTFVDWEAQGVKVYAVYVKGGLSDAWYEYPDGATSDEGLTDGSDDPKDISHVNFFWCPEVDPDPDEPGSICAAKFDLEDDEKEDPLSGWTFTLYEKQDGEWSEVSSKTTDAEVNNGRVSWVELTEGEYKVEETSAPAGEDDWVHHDPLDGVHHVDIKPGAETEVHFINRIDDPDPDEEGTLTVEKKLVGEDGEDISNDDTEFTIEVFSGEETVDTVQLKAGEHKTWTDLEICTEYLVEETGLDELPEGYSLLGYEVWETHPMQAASVENEGPDREYEPGEQVDVHLEDGSDVTIVVTNQYIEPEDPDPDEVAELRVEKILVDEDDNEIIDDDTEFNIEVRADGEYLDSAMLKGGEYKHWLDLPVETTFCVEEIDLEDLPLGYSLLGYELWINGEEQDLDNDTVQFELEDEDTAEVVVINQYLEPEDPDPDEAAVLTVGKVLFDEDGEVIKAEDDESEFTLVVSSEDTELDRVDLKSGKIESWTDLPVGESYSVEELEVGLPENCFLVGYEIWINQDPETEEGEMVEAGETVDFDLEDGDDVLVLAYNRYAVEEVPEVVEVDPEVTKVDPDLPYTGTNALLHLGLSALLIGGGALLRKYGARN